MLQGCTGAGDNGIPAPQGSAGGTPALGVNASLQGARPFPDDNPWNTPIDSDPVDPDSDLLIDSIGRTATLHPDFGADWNGGPFGIPYVVVSGDTPRVPVSFQYADESDPGPYPIPPGAPIEGGAIFDLSSNALRPAGWTSSDAAGLPIFPGLVRYDEVMEGNVIRHALRFTAARTRRAYVYPARHFASASTDPSLPPMGMRVRLKAGVDISGFPPGARVVLQALKAYGMFLADNGGNWFLSGAPDSRWNDDELNTLKRLTGNEFEVVKMGPLTTQ
jgi:hypothetical protein